MDLVKKKEDCCGCRTCEKVCPKEAIQMEADDCGFLYPKIDSEKCVDCGLCLKKCAFQSGYKKRKEFDPYYAYGVRHKDERALMNSRSGGAFTAISNAIFRKRGIVYGAGFDSDRKPFYIKHMAATTKEERNALRGSKYVQSDLNDVFPEIKAKLEKGKTVLFSGTGCQVGALYAYLPKEYENLYTIDIICHGVPSPKLWEDFLHMREKEKGGKAERANFRNKKRYGWKAHRETVVISGQPYTSRIYTRLFYGCNIRPSCLKCVYANTDRPADITLADFWGHEKAMPDLWNDDKGVSLVLVNNAHGKELWEKSRQEVLEVEVTGYPFQHGRLRKPMEKPENYDEFWEDYAREGFEYCAEKYSKHKPQEADIENGSAKSTAGSAEKPEEPAEEAKEERVVSIEEPQMQAAKEEQKEAAQNTEQPQSAVGKFFKSLFGKK